MGESGEAYEQALRGELERRIKVIDGYDASTFGLLSEPELLVAAIATVVLPIFIVWLFA